MNISEHVLAVSGEVASVTPLLTGFVVVRDLRVVRMILIGKSCGI